MRRAPLLAAAAVLSLAACDTSIDLEGVRCAPSGAPCPVPLVTSRGTEDGGAVCRCVSEDRTRCGNGRVEGAEECDPGQDDATCRGCRRAEADAGSTDGGPGDAGTGTDAGQGDGGAADAGPSDGGSPDAGASDAGAADAGAFDAGVPDAGPASLCGNGKLDSSEQCDDGNATAGDGCEADCTYTSTSTVLGCSGMNLAPPDAGACTVTAGTGGSTDLLITGTILGPTQTFVGGQVLVRQGVITCAGCFCQGSAGGNAAIKVQCPGTIVSPGLINAHEHLSFAAYPFNQTSERYEHRHDWRKGQNSHTPLGTPVSSQLESRMAELRHLMSGTTSILGTATSGTGLAGLLRNLDSPAPELHRLDAGTRAVKNDTFIYGDSPGVQLDAGCGYPATPVPPSSGVWLAHLAEGVATSAANEIACFPQTMLVPQLTFTQAIAANAATLRQWADAGVSIVWSPRSNVALYGDTVPMTEARRYGVRVALGTDWNYTGSMNMLRELRCADFLNTSRFGHAYSDAELWRMATQAGGEVSGFPEVGRIAQNAVADLAFFRKTQTSPHRSVILAEPADVVAVFRGGAVLYGDAALVAALSTTGNCEALDVCGTAKRVCLIDELLPEIGGPDAGTSWASLSTTTSSYPLFECGAPQGEPTCVPQRLFNSRNGSVPYPLSDGGLDQDKDGLADVEDDCASIFNPVRVCDDGHQSDLDGDGLGDACDPCPLSDAGSCL